HRHRAILRLRTVDAELADIVLAPAAHHPARVERARELVAGAELLRRRQARDRRRRAVVAVGAVADLAVAVLAPALDRLIGEHRARVRRAERDLLRGRDAGDLHGHAAVARAVAELALIVAAPAPHGAAIVERARE